MNPLLNIIDNSDEEEGSLSSDEKGGNLSSLPDVPNTPLLLPSSIEDLTSEYVPYIESVSSETDLDSISCCCFPTCNFFTVWFEVWNLISYWARKPFHTKKE
jgi:hypothetical protein